MKNTIITLTSDFGTKDYFVSVLKGHLYSVLPNPIIVDITHDINPFSITETAYVIKNSYSNFPKGSIHIIAVDAFLSIENEHMVLFYDDHFFICANNGVLSLLIDGEKEFKAVKIDLANTRESSYYLENFIKATKIIYSENALNKIGSNFENIKIVKEIEPFYNDKNNQIEGHVIYIDNYGNLITNIQKESFTNFAKGRKYTIYANRIEYQTIVNNYNDIVNYTVDATQRNDEGKKLALFNSDGFLELAIYKSDLKSVGGAASLFGLSYRDKIIVRFSSL